MLKYLIKTTKTPDDDTGNGLDDDTANDDCYGQYSEMLNLKYITKISTALNHGFAYWKHVLKIGLYEV
jgi:hypothetical protein